MNKQLLNPKELMISRYEAFKRQDWSYIAQTSIYQTFEELNHPSSIEWLKLEVLDAKDDIVEFKAYYKEADKLYVLHEKSKFIQVDGVWKYLDGELYDTKIQRNESCPCGSKKKFKRCCG
jgi:SEC-C motif-containing protein